MAWTAPRTWTTGELVTAALLNAHVRDNLLETYPAKVTTAGDIAYATAANAIARLPIGSNTRGLRANSAGTAPEYSSGNTVQVVNTQTGTASTATTVFPLDDSIPQNTEGDQLMTLAVTPTNTANILLVDVTIVLAASIAVWVGVGLFQDSVAGALAATAEYIGDANTGAVIHFRHKMTAGTVSSTTFKIRAGPSSAATLTLNGAGGLRYFGGVQPSSITITEISA